MLTKRVGFIGPGKVGCSLGRYISETRGIGFAVSGYYGRSEGSAKEAAAFAGGSAFYTPEELAAESDLLLLTVPDKAIAEVWSSFAEKLPDRADPIYIGHCSGSLSAEIFLPRPRHCSFGSIHPLIAVFDKENSYKKFSGACFTVEGDEGFAAMTEGLLTALENPWREIDASQKNAYHAASVMASNLVCALAYEAMKTFKACGFDEGFADTAWRSLFIENAENINSLGPVSALTGPVERCDTETVRRHLSSLAGDTREIYLLLSRSLVETAQRKNPGRDYSELKTLLENMG